jgi:hypothetical protein
MRTTQSQLIYIQNQGLLFQFILAEFLTTYPLIQEIQRSFRSLKFATPKAQLSHKIEAPLKQLLFSLTQLTGHRDHDPHLANPPPCESHLKKLRHYYNLFNTPDNVKPKVLADLKKCNHLALSSALMIQLSVIDILSRTQVTKMLTDVPLLYEEIERLIRYMKRSANLLIPLILFYQADENVVYFLLTHRHEIDALYQQNLVHKLLHKMYEGSFERLEKFLKQRYALRGFDALLPLISQHITLMASSKVLALPELHNSTLGAAPQ